MSRISKGNLKHEKDIDEAKQFLKLARSVYNLITCEADSSKLEIIREVARSTSSVIHKMDISEKDNPFIHPNLGLELIEYADFKEYSKSHPDFNEHISQAKRVNKMLCELEELTNNS